MARILMTGGTGFIRANLAQYCLGRSDGAINVEFRPPRQTKQSMGRRDADLLEGKTPGGWRARSARVLGLVRSLQERQGSARAVFSFSMSA